MNANNIQDSYSYSSKSLNSRLPETNKNTIFPQEPSPQFKRQKQETEKEQFHEINLTQNPVYLLEFCKDGFCWNEEVLLSPPFSSFYSRHSSISHCNDDHRVYPSIIAERIRKQRVNQETVVAEIRLESETNPE